VQTRLSPGGFQHHTTQIPTVEAFPSAAGAIPLFATGGYTAAEQCRLESVHSKPPPTHAQKQQLMHL